MLKFDAAGLFVTEMNKMVSFYRDVMGMKCDWNGTDAYTELFSGNMRMIMYSREDFEKLVSRTFDYPKLNGTLELSFSLPKFENVDEEYNRVIKAGAQSVTAPADMPWGQRTCYVADPDGNLIEIGSFNRG